MAVVINEFEVVEQAPLQRAPGDEVPLADAAAAQQLDPLDLWLALRALESRALRAWAH